MLAIANWIRDALRDHPEVALFLTLAAGHWIGRLRIKRFKLGAVVGCLLTGVAVAQLGVTVPSIVGRVFFLLFLFAVGYKTGPQFFRSLGRKAVVPIVLTVLFCATGLFTAYVVARVLKFDVGTAAGLLSGGLLSSEAMGTATDAIGRLAVSEDLHRAMTANVTVGYAVCYVVSLFIGIFILTEVGPWLMRIDLRAECQKLEAELGMKKEESGVISAYKQFVMRAYRIPQSMDNKTATALENLFSPNRVFVERVGTQQGILDADPDLRLHAGDRVVLSGRPGVLGGSNNPLRLDEVEEQELLDVPAIQFDYILERKDLLYKTFSEILHTLGGEVATRGVYVRKVVRAGEELPLGPKVVLEPGDVLTLVGARRHLNRIAEQLGSVERLSDATDLVALCLTIAVGGLIGLPALHLARLHIGLGIPVGVLLMSLMLGWLRSVRPGFGTIPGPVISVLDSLGLSAFVAVIGINAGLSFIHGVRTSGLLLFVCGVIVCVTPYLATMLLGRYVFKVHPGILLGICAGSCTFSPGLAALQEKADSRVPVLGYGLSYALGAILYALMGSVIVAMVHKG
jgi:putative transport protein